MERVERSGPPDRIAQGDDQQALPHCFVGALLEQSWRD
jgi:hypothetical protein